MAKPIRIPIETPYNAKGAVEAARALGALAKAEQAAAVASARTAQAQSQAGVSAQRLATAQNQTAISAQKLAQAEAKTAGELAKTEAAQSRAAQSAMKLEQAQARAAQGGRTLGQSLSGLVSAAGALGVALGAQQIASAAVELAKTGAQAQLVEMRFNALADAAGEGGDALLSALRKASGGEISDLNLQLAANRANLLGVATSAEQLGVLMAIARDRAQNLGTTATEAFNDLVTGLGRGSPLILDNLGIMVDIKGANEAYAASVGKTVAQLTDAEKKQALINQVVRDGKASMEATGGAADSAAGAYARLGTAAENAATRIGEALAAATAGPADDVANGINRLMEGSAGLNDAWVSLIATAQANAAYQTAYAQALNDGLSPTEAATAASYAYKAVIDEASVALSKGTTGGTQWGAATNEAAVAADTAAAAIGEMLTQTLADADAKAAADEQARMFAEAQQVIANLGGAVNAGLTTSAAGADILAARYGIAYAQALLLIDAQARIAGGQARLAGQKRNTMDLVPGGVGASAPGKRGQSDADILATVQKTTDEITAVGVRAQPVRTAAVKAGGSARASAEQSSADKIKDIAQQTADKLVAIDQRAAEQRAKAQASLANAINQSSADLVASQEANDLELVGASEDRIAELTAREQAEAQARIATIEAVKEARAIADAGDAEQAQAVLDQRTQQIQAQQALDEEYAKRRAELAGDPAATEALKTQYDEATAALADATQVRIDLAAQEAQQRADAVAAEKQAVLDSASAQAAALGTTGDAASAAAGRVQALTDAINAIPEAKTVTITVEEKGGGASSSSSGGGSGGSSAKAAGGGSFVTSGPTHFTVGDNPGGVEIVTVTPVSGVGTSSASGPNIHMAGGGTAIAGASDDAIKRLEDANRRQILPTAGGGATAKPKSGGGGGGGSGGDAKASVDEALKNEKEALQLIKDVADLRKELRKGVPPPIAATLIADLSAEAARISTTVRNTLVPTTKEQVEALSNWQALVGDSVSILKDVGSLSVDLFRDYQRPSREQIGMFVGDAQEIARQVDQAARIYQSDALENAKTFSEGVGATFSAIGEGLRVIDQLRFGDLTVDVGKLQQFQDSSLAILNTADILAARADRIDQNALASLSTATSAINAQAEALINLSAVPFGNLGGLAAGLGGGSSSSVTFGPGSIVINGAQGMDMSALANLVAQRIGSQIGSRR